MGALYGPGYYTTLMNKKAINEERLDFLHSWHPNSMPRLMSHHPMDHPLHLANYTTITTIRDPLPYTTHPLSSMFWDKVSVDKWPVHPHPTTPQFKKLGCETNVNPCKPPQARDHYKVKGVCV